LSTFGKGLKWNEDRKEATAVMTTTAAMKKQGGQDLNWLGARRRRKRVPLSPTRERGRDEMTASSQIVIGCSAQLPNEVRAYRLMGSSTDGGLLLRRRGVTYSATRHEVSAYRELLQRMLGPVLAIVPPDLRTRAQGALTRRWNREWGVEVEDLIEAEPAADRVVARWRAGLDSALRYLGRVRA
jgi:hypothetical protein